MSLEEIEAARGPEVCQERERNIVVFAVHYTCVIPRAVAAQLVTRGTRVPYVTRGDWGRLLIQSLRGHVYSFV